MTKPKESAKVQVFCRFRPMLRQERSKSEMFLSEDRKTVLMHEGKQVFRFFFAKSFDDSVTQEQLYEQSAAHIVRDFLQVISLITLIKNLITMIILISLINHNNPYKPHNPNNPNNRNNPNNPNNLNNPNNPNKPCNPDNLNNLITITPQGRNGTVLAYGHTNTGKTCACFRLQPRPQNPPTSSPHLRISSSFLQV